MISSLPATSCSIEEAKNKLSHYEWLTEDYPPYNYINADGKLKGIFTDIVLAVFDKLELKLSADDIELMPWARLYKNMQATDRYAAFSMTYTDERAKAFRIVTTPLSTKISIMVLAENHQQLIKTPMENIVLGVVREDIGHHLVKRAKLPSPIVPTTSANSMIKMLVSERVNAIAYAEEVAQFQLENLLLNDKKIVPLLALDSNAYHGFVFHKSTPNCVVDLFQEVIMELSDNGRLVEIRDRYISQTNTEKP